MRLSGIDLQGTLRFTQPNDALDIQIDLMANGKSEIKSELYTLVFFDLMNGTVTGADDAANGIETGISFVVKDPDGNAIASTPVAKLDWYEGEDAYYVQAISDSVVTLTADARIAEVEVYYTANDSGSAKQVLIASTTTPAASSFATDDGAGNKGILVQSGNGALNVTCNYLLVISK